MAAIASISNGEAMSSVRTKLNSVITEINILDPTDWVDYSSTSTILGWSSFTTKILRYRVIGKQVFVQFLFNGASNATTSTFTLPSNSVNANYTFGYSINNGVVIGSGLVNTNISSNIVNCYSSATAGAWTASGTKVIAGEFFYEIA